MRRAFGFDVLACPRCGGRLRLVALIDEAAVVQRILGHLGFPPRCPRHGPLAHGVAVARTVYWPAPGIRTVTTSL